MGPRLFRPRTQNGGPLTFRGPRRPPPASGAPSTLSPGGLAARAPVCGAGKVLQAPRGAVFCLSQRAEHIWEGVSSATTRSRPIINTRDEPHADAERYRRLHVIVGDSNMNEVTTLLKVGSADIVLRMIEAGVVMRDLTLENPIRAIREVSHDITGRRKVRLANGKEASALDIQHEYFSKAADFVDRRGGGGPPQRPGPNLGGGRDPRGERQLPPASPAIGPDTQLAPVSGHTR